MKSEATSGISVKKKELRNRPGKKTANNFPRGGGQQWSLARKCIVGPGRSGAGGGEPAKVEAPAAAPGRRQRRKPKKKIPAPGRRSLLKDCWNKSAALKSP